MADLQNLDALRLSEINAVWSLTAKTVDGQNLYIVPIPIVNIVRSSFSSAKGPCAESSDEKKQCCSRFPQDSLLIT